MVNRLLIVTWNVHELRSWRDGSRFGVANTVRTADLVFLQEAPEDLDKRDMPHQYTVSWLLEPSLAQPGAPMGLVISCRYPLRVKERMLFQNPGWTSTAAMSEVYSHPKGALIAEVAYPERPLRVACLHLLPPRIFGIDEESASAKAYVSAVTAQLTMSRTPLHIIAGDFNNRTRMQFFGGAGYQSATAGRSTRVSGDSHDDVLIDPSLSLVAVEVEPGPSDHHAVKVEVAVA